MFWSTTDHFSRDLVETRKILHPSRMKDRVQAKRFLKIPKHSKLQRGKASSSANPIKGKSSAPTKKLDKNRRRKIKLMTSKPRPKQKQSAPRTEAQYLAKPEKFKDSWDRVLTVVSKMRSEKVSLTRASRDVGISPRTVTRLGRSALRKRKNGTYAAKAKDNLLRLVMIPTTEGAREIAVRGSEQASLLGEYWNAVYRYLQTGDQSRLRQFRSKHIKDANGVEVLLPTDRAVLDRLGSAGVLSFESLYARTA